MAGNANNAKTDPPVLEIAITLFCWFESISASPYVVKTMFGPVVTAVKYEFAQYVPTAVKLWINKYVPGDFLIMWGVVFLTSFLLVPHLQLIRAQDRDQVSSTESRKLRVARAIRVLRSFGLVLVKEWLLRRMNVGYWGHDTFTRPPYWPLAPEMKDKVDRVNFTDGVGKEYQYGANFDFISVREHPAGTETYGPPARRQPKWDDVKLLLVASTYFPRWYFGYLIRFRFLR